MASYIKPKSKKSKRYQQVGTNKFKYNPTTNTYESAYSLKPVTVKGRDNSLKNKVANNAYPVSSDESRTNFWRHVFSPISYNTTMEYLHNPVNFDSRMNHKYNTGFWNHYIGNLGIDNIHYGNYARYNMWDLTKKEKARIKKKGWEKYFKDRLNYK